jgi:predicted glycosyltransferase
MPIIRYLEKEHEIIITARDYSETLPMLEAQGINPIVWGEYKGKNRLRKALRILKRMYKLYRQIPRFDISLSLGGNYTATVSWLRRKPSIVFSDNDISFKGPALSFGTYFIFPAHFDTSSLRSKYRLRPDRINTFEGFKEDIYISGYSPDPDFLKKIPFTDFITIRPEDLKASYVSSNSKTIIPILFKIFQDENILFLPRYIEEKDYAQGYSNIFIPDKPLAGLDVCYYTKAMLTGGGTFAREAALLGTPAVSFFPGKTFLTVDSIMQEKGWEFKSRNAIEIYNYVKKSGKNKSGIERSKLILAEVLSIIDKIFVRGK